jgi:RHS repeat-associated protein
VYDGGRVLEEYGTNPQTPEITAVPSANHTEHLATYIYSGGYIDDPLQMRRKDVFGSAGAERRLNTLTDAQYNIVALQDDSTKVIVERVSYDTFGTPLFENTNTASTQNDPTALRFGSQRDASFYGNPYAFTGRRWEPGLQLYDYRFRWFDPSTGRFITRDPIGIWGDGLNVGNGYTYVGNNPWTHVDPWGLQACETVIIAGGTSGGFAALLGPAIPAALITGAGVGGYAIGTALGAPYIGEAIADFIVPPYSPVGTNTLPHPIPVPIPTPGPLIPPAIPDITNQPNTGNPNPGTPNAAPRPERLPPPSEWNLPQPATPPISTTGSPILPQPNTPPFPPLPLLPMADDKGYRHPQREALRNLLNNFTHKGRKPLDPNDTETVIRWAKEYGYPGLQFGPPHTDPINNHWEGGPHIHLWGVGRAGNHVPIIPPCLTK